MVNEWIERGQVIAKEVLKAETVDEIKDRTGTHKLNTATDFEKSEIIRILMDIAEDAVDRLRTYEPQIKDAGFEDVFHVIYGYRFQI